MLDLNDELKEAEVGYCIEKKYWGKGIVAEALKEVLRFCFENVGFIKIKAKHHIDNPNSGIVMKKAGMKYIETKESSSVLRPDILIPCACYEIINGKI